MASSTTAIRDHAPTGDDFPLMKETAQLWPSTATGLQDLPDHVLVQIFRHSTEYVLAVRPGTRTATKRRGISRITLRSVCLRWKMLNESSTCIALPEELPIFTFEEVSLRRAINKLNVLGALPGSISIVFVFSHFSPFETLSKQDGIAHIDMLSRALSAPHKATLSVAFQHIPLGLVQRLLVHGGPRIVNLAIVPSNDPIPFPPAPKVALPIFPSLSRIQLGCVNFSRARVESFRSNSWAWLFQPAVCQQLLSVKISFALASDVPWILNQCPALLDLSLSALFDYPRTEVPILHDLAHPNINQLSIEGSMHCAIAFPSLKTCSLEQSYSILLPVSLSNITSISIPVKGLPPLEVETLLHSLPAVSNLCLINVYYAQLKTVADVLADEAVVPCLHTLHLEYSRGYEPEPESGAASAVPDRLVAIAQALHRIVSHQPDGGSRVEVLDFRLVTSDGPEVRLECWRLMHNLESGRAVMERGPVPSPKAFDRPFDIWLQEIQEYLDREMENPNPNLAQLSEMWSDFMTSNAEVDYAVFQGERWIDFSSLWIFVERLRAIFAGTNYLLHEEILDHWKRCLGPATKGWMVSIGPSSAARKKSAWEGVYYGRRTGSMMYDLRLSNYVTVLENGCLVLRHDILKIIDHPSETLLKRLQLLPPFY